MQTSDNSALLCARDLVSAFAESSSQGSQLVDPVSGKAEIAKALIAIAKRRLDKDPRDVVEWVDRARMYLVLGQTKQARRCIEVALLLAPFDRFVLRSAFRFFVHAGQKERALSIVQNNITTQCDPWLMAAEISGSSLVDKSPQSVREARRILGSGSFRAFDMAELAAALGTLEIENGAHIKAKKLFQMSLEDPNENVVAQVKWAEYYHRTGHVMPTVLNMPGAYEAQAKENYQKRDWNKCLAATSAWLGDQPFSAAPAIQGSFVAVLIGDYDAAANYAKAGLKPNPKDHFLLNNLAVALALQNKTKEATACLDEIEDHDTSDSRKIVNSATRGLIAYKEANFTMGRAYYQLAVQNALSLKSYGLYVRAALNWLREEALRFPDEAPALLKIGRTISRYSGEVDTLSLIDKLENVAAIVSYSKRPSIEAAIDIPLPPTPPQLARNGVPNIQGPTAQRSPSKHSGDRFRRSHTHNSLPHK